MEHLRKTPGGYWIKIHGGPFQPRLIDIVGSLLGRFIALEVKRPGQKPTPRQQKTLADLERAGAIVAVVWSTADCDQALKNSFPNLLDTSLPSTYLGTTSGAQALAKKKEKPEMTNRKATSTKAKRAAPVVEDEEDLEDLEDLDDFEDEMEDDEDEDEEDEDETPRSRNDRKTAATKTIRKPSAVKTTKPAASKNGTKARGNASNLTPRRVTDGMKGASDLASEVGSDARTVRVILRKLKTEKSENGLYEWKPGKAFDTLVKSIKKEVAAKNA